MDTAVWRKHKLSNSVQSLLLLAAMALLLSALGAVIAGSAGVVLALVVGGALVIFGPGMSPGLVLRLYRARLLSPHEAPELYRMLASLAERAGLPSPELHYIRSELINAFAVGTRAAAAIAVTDGFLRSLSAREIHAVLAHEMSHIRHNDMWVMGLADLFSRMTSLFSAAGQILLILNLPLLLFSDYAISWTAILLLIFAPTLSALMQLALSRTREYDADLGAVELSGDPQGLASALARMERYQGHLFEQILIPGHRVPDPSLLRSHPPTEERVRRLLKLTPADRAPSPPLPVISSPISAGTTLHRRPRWHLRGIWY